MYLYKDLPEMVKQKVRGGDGEVRCRDYLQHCPGGLPFNSFGLNEMQPGATIPEHCHSENAEFYFVVSGQGTGVHNGRVFEIGPGDAWVCEPGETHGIYNRSEIPLSFISVFFTKG